MTIRKESKQYIRQQRKIDADLVKRPNEILKRTTDDGNLKLTFKSPTYYEKDIVVTKNAMLSTIPLIKTYASLETSESFILDLEGQEIITYNLTQNTTITDVINYNNGMSYKLYLKQDEVGGKSFVFDETISNITLFDNFQIDQTPNSITQIKIDVVEDTLYVQSYVKYKKVANLGSIAFTIDTTLGDGQSTFTLPLKEQQNVYIYDPENPDNYDSIEFGDYMNFDFVVDWGDGQSDHITSFNDLAKTHTYSTNGTYSIKMTGLIEGFGTITNEFDWSYTTEDYEKIITVDEISYTGLKECDFMFSDCGNLTSVNNVSGDWNNHITNMGYLFQNCESLTTLDVSNWNISNVTNISNMFSSCSSLATLDLSNWNVSNVNDVRYMFDNCSSLATLDVSNWDVSNVSDMLGMFNGCSSLATLNVSNWDVSKVSDMSYMFGNTPLDTTSYDALLISWSQLPSLQSNVQLDAQLAKYSSGAATTARGILTSAPNIWKIYDGGQVI